MPLLNDALVNYLLFALVHFLRDVVDNLLLFIFIGIHQFDAQLLLDELDLFINFN